MLSLLVLFILAINVKSSQFAHYQFKCDPIRKTYEISFEFLGGEGHGFVHAEQHRIRFEYYFPSRYWAGFSTADQTIQGVNVECTSCHYNNNHYYPSLTNTNHSNLYPKCIEECLEDSIFVATIHYDEENSMDNWKTIEFQIDAEESIDSNETIYGIPSKLLEVWGDDNYPYRENAHFKTELVTIDNGDDTTEEYIHANFWRLYEFTPSYIDEADGPTEWKPFTESQDSLCFISIGGLYDDEYIDDDDDGFYIDTQHFANIHCYPLNDIKVDCGQDWSFLQKKKGENDMDTESIDAMDTVTESNKNRDIESDSNTDTDIDMNDNADNIGDSDTDDTFTDTDTGTDTDINHDTGSDSATDRDTDTDTNSVNDLYIDTDTDINSDSEGEGDTDIGSDWDTDIDIDSGSDMDSDLSGDIFDSESDADTDIDSDSTDVMDSDSWDTGNDVDSSSGSDMDTDTDIDMDFSDSATSDTDTDTDIDTASDSSSESDMDTDMDTDIFDMDTESDTDIDTGDAEIIMSEDEETVSSTNKPTTMGTTTEIDSSTTYREDCCSLISKISYNDINCLNISLNDQYIPDLQRKWKNQKCGRPDKLPTELNKTVKTDCDHLWAYFNQIYNICYGYSFTKHMKLYNYFKTRGGYECFEVNTDKCTNLNNVINSKNDKQTESKLAKMEEGGGLTITSLGLLVSIIAFLAIYILYWFCCSNTSKGYRQQQLLYVDDDDDDDIDTNQYTMNQQKQQKHFNDKNDNSDDDDDDDDDSDWSEDEELRVINDDYNQMGIKIDNGDYYEGTQTLKQNQKNVETLH